jgi:hypothetical protein
MHPRIQELLDYLDRQVAVLRAAYESVSADRRATRPAADRWSPAEIVRHVDLVNRSVARVIGRLAENASASPPESDTSPVMPTLDISRIIDRTRRLTASESAQPKDTEVATLWKSFAATHRELKDVIARADGLAMGSVSAPHPALGSFNGYEWIAFAGAHAARHAAQIREIVGAR